MSILSLVILCFSFSSFQIHDYFWNWVMSSHERTPIDEAVNMGKMDVIDAINTTIAELEFTGVNIS